GTYALGLFIGLALSSLSLVVATTIGWRNTYFTVAGFGFLLVVLMVIFVKEPPRSTSCLQPKEEYLTTAER
ncbi:unnamed protein product, partial [Choristocarpus tenellus]